MNEISEINTKTLQNGLVVICESNPRAKSCAVAFFVRTGARDETPNESGVSHFLEHMVFKGTDSRSALDITYALGNCGAQANAYTSEETTVYYAGVLPEYRSQIQELLSDMLRPALDQVEFDTEKNVILEEIALYQDRPHFYFFENAFQEYFKGHTAGNSILGSVDSIRELSRDMMLDYFRRRYSAGSIVLVASGNVNWDDFLADAEKYCGNWPNQAVEREVPRHEHRAIRKDFTKKGIHQCHVLLVSPGPSSQDEDRFAAALLSSMLGDSSGSRLYWELIDSGLADTAVADLDDKDGTGTFYAYASTEADKLGKVAEILRSVVSEPAELSAEELERARAKLVSKMVLGGELPIGRIMALGNEWIYRRKVHRLREVIERVRAVTLDEVIAVANKYKLNDWAEFRLLPE